MRRPLIWARSLPLPPVNDIDRAINAGPQRVVVIAAA